MGKDLLLIASLILWAPSARAELPCDPAQILDSYIQAILAGDLELARSFWLDEDLLASTRLGIDFRDIDLKLDSDSPLSTWAPPVNLAAVNILARQRPNGSDKLDLAVVWLDQGDTLRHTYHAVRENGCWKLASKLGSLARETQPRETEFVRLHARDRSRLNEAGLTSLDHFIAMCAQRLGIASSRMDLLAREKLGYVLVSAEEITALTGVATEGVANFQLDAVVSQRLCHYHELAHLMVNFALGELPLRTLPFLQEGLAVSLGGRWGRSAEVILDLGDFLLESGLIEIEQLITAQGFYGEMPDLSYAAAGLFADFLMAELGGEDVLALYRSASGSASEIASMDTDGIQQEIARRLERSWPELMVDFHHHRLARRPRALRPASIGFDFERTLKEGEMTLRIGGSESEWCFEITHPEATGAVLIDLTGASLPSSYRSRLFEEHFPGRIHAGQRYGLVFTAEEAGLYDYATDMLLAKHVEQMSPAGQGEAFSEGTLRLRLREDRLPVDLRSARLTLVRR